ncbi:Predicted ATPase [Stigmatella aurantiaca]|uniref:Predicted ATPase n=1 Tax=Stigmatella aurantiaca TaxID=41 RepID=A0A1H8BN81_STIAU|nr:AAA family ATPase [Stigmatella aurantiaca]SEM84222.1 Predicted ATPase [Stigmatella aurantiaca]
MTESIRVQVDEIRLRNFRAFENARLRLSDLTFVLGRNGSGKSSLLDAVEFLRECIEDSLPNALDRRGGILKVRRVGADNESDSRLGLAVCLRLQVGERTLSAVYGFELHGTSGTPGYSVREGIQFAGGGGPSFDRRDDNFESSIKISPVPPAMRLVLPHVLGADSVWEAIGQAIGGLRAYQLDPSVIGSLPPIDEGSRLARNGVNVGDVLRHLEGGREHRWIEEHIAAFTDGVQKVRTDSVIGRRLLLIEQDTGTGTFTTFDATQISQGTLRALAVLLALRQQPAPTLVLIDEIENSVHPSAVAVLVGAAEAMCGAFPVVLTSHSPEVLSHPACTAERVRLVEWQKGRSRVHRLNEDTAKAVSPLNTVGDMLRSNALWPEEHPEELEGDLFTISEPSA